MDKIEQLLRHPKFLGTLEEIKKIEELRPFCRHDLDHFIDVAKIMELENVQSNAKFSRELIWGAGLLHDIGKAVQYQNGVSHEIAGQEIASSILKECGYALSDIKMICNAIGEHGGFIERSGFSELLRKSDKLSRRCFECKANKECKWPEEMRNKRSYL